MAPSFRDRFFTPRVARAVTSPSGIVLAGGGAALAILAGGGAPLAVVAAIGAWAARVAVAIPSGRPAAGKIDPFRVGEPWRRFVTDAVQAQRRFDETVRRSRPGPVRERLQSVGVRVQDAVNECWRIACQGDQLDGALRALDVGRIERELEGIYEERRRQQGNPDSDASLYRAQQAIEAQLKSSDRLRAVALDAENKLRVLNAQLDEAVARSIEVSLHSSDASAIGALTDSVDNVVGELEALRQGLEEASAVAPGTRGTGTPGTT